MTVKHFVQSQGFKRGWLCSGKHKSLPNLTQTIQTATNTFCFLKCPKQRRYIVMSACSVLKTKWLRLFSKAKPQTLWWYNWDSEEVQLHICNMYVSAWPTDCIWHVTFKRELVCMKLAEWFWQAESHALTVWSILFSWKNACGWLVWMGTKQ